VEADPCGEGEAQVIWRIRTDPFPTVYELEDPEVIDSAMFGSCLRGDFRREGEDHWTLDGFFRLDRADLLHPAHQQQLQEAA
jgi:hypothetical protein